MDNTNIHLSADVETVKRVRDGLKKNGGYCPCRIGRLPENKCMCQEFRDQLSDPDFHGPCHCGLYVRE